MIKWPWKVQESAHQTALPWQEALSIPLLTCLTEQEQSKLVALAERFLQQKRLVPLQGFELNSLRSCRIALLFCLPVLELGLEWLDGFHEVLIYPAPFVVDDEYAVVGTINLDYRSLYLHYECAAWLYKTKSVLDVRDDYLETLKVSQKITSADFNTIPWYRKIMFAFLRIFAPLM